MDYNDNDNTSEHGNKHGAYHSNDSNMDNNDDHNSRANNGHGNDNDGHGNGCMASIRPTFLFLGSMGILTIIMCTPLLAIAHYSGIEVFHMPSSRAWPYLIISAALVCIASHHIHLNCHLVVR
jgi:hypothetical protein